MAAIVAVPQLFIFVETEEKSSPSDVAVYKCDSAGYSAEWQRKLYFTFLTGYMLIIPTGIMSFCYASLIRVMGQRAGADTDEPRVHFVSSRRAGEAEERAESDPATRPKNRFVVSGNMAKNYGR